MQDNGKLWIAINEEEDIIGTIAIKQYNQNEAELKEVIC